MKKLSVKEVEGWAETSDSICDGMIERLGLEPDGHKTWATTTDEIVIELKEVLAEELPKLLAQARESERERIAKKIFYSKETIDISSLEQLTKLLARSHGQDNREVGGVQADHNRLVRELDVLMCGEEGAAKQASLCDLVAYFPQWKEKMVAQARESERERIFQAISTDGGDFCKKVYKALGIKTSGDAERPNLLASAEGDK